MEKWRAENEAVAMDARPCTMADLDYVMENLDEESGKEIIRAGFDEMTARTFLVDHVQAGTADALLHQGELLAIFAWTRHETAIHSSFVATPAFFSPSIPSVRFSRRYLPALQRRNAGLPIISYCYSSRAQVRRWYELMSFVLIEEKGTCKTFYLDKEPTARQSYPELPAK